MAGKQNIPLVNEALMRGRDDCDCSKKVKKSAGRLLDGFVTSIVDTIKLKNSGKYISLGVICVVVFFFYKFLSIHNYSHESMQLVIPYLGNLATLVFGSIAGVKGASKIIEKIGDFKNLQGALKDEKSKEE